MDELERNLPADEEPLYNIGVVARMTGIPVATLRIWERRYGFPRSSRTAGGHRLYSEKEVARLRWIKTRSEQGMQTGQAIRALQHEEKEGRLPEPPPLAPIADRLAGDEFSLGVFRGRLTSALLAHNLDKADQVIGEVMAVYPLEELVLEVVGPVLAEIGQAWLDQRITVAAEHLATNYLRQRLLMWMEMGPPALAVRPVILACAPEELHEGSLLMLGVLLRRRRWPVSYLGQSVPLSGFATLIQELKPSAVVWVAMMEEAARALADWQPWLGDAVQARRPLIGFGGRIYTEQPGWRDKGPGIFLGVSLPEAVETLERLLREATVFGA